MKNFFGLEADDVSTFVLMCFGFLFGSLSFQQVNDILAIWLKVISIVSFTMVVVINLMAFSYSIKGMYTRIVRFIRKNIWQRKKQ